jgi:hypothetical protein
MFSASVAPRVELLLWRPDGDPWIVSFSPGIERFIGHYPRLGGIMSDGPLLEFQTVHPERR